MPNYTRVNHGLTLWQRLHIFLATSVWKRLGGIGARQTEGAQDARKLDSSRGLEKAETPPPERQARKVGYLHLLSEPRRPRGTSSPARRNPTRPRRGESSRRRGVGAARSSAAEGEACLSTGPTPRRPQKKARRPKRRFSDPSSSSPQSPQRKAASPRTRCRSPDRTRCGERAPPEWPARRQSPPTGEWGTWRWPRC